MPTDVLRQLAEEVMDLVRRVDAITALDLELSALWKRFLQVSTPRYITPFTVSLSRYIAI